MKYAVVAKNISKKYRQPLEYAVLDGIDLSVERGQAVAIKGRSGEGKSTLLHILATLDQPDQGTIEICGQPVNRVSVYNIRNKNIGFIYQSFHLLDDCTVLENILMPAKIARKNTQKSSPSYNRAKELLQAVGLDRHETLLAKQLSGGEKQRVAIARALCNDPEVIFADEPTGNLDFYTAESIHTLLMKLVREFKKTLVVVTHSDELASLCDTTYQLHSKKLLLPSKA